MSENVLGTLPPVVTHQWPANWSVCGSGVFHWSVFKLYRATLYAPGDFDPSQPFALDLAYLRTIDAQQIVDTTMREIERLSRCDASVLSEWKLGLSKILPDVKLGDHLIGLFLPNQGVKFYSATNALGEVMSPAFAGAFAAIWLGPDTHSPTLRSALLGLKA